MCASWYIVREFAVFAEATDFPREDGVAKALLPWPTVFHCELIVSLQRIRMLSKTYLPRPAMADVKNASSRPYIDVLR